MAKKEINCTSINLVLCGQPLKNVLGLIGRKKIYQGTKLTKKDAIYELLCTNGVEFTDGEIEEGLQLISKTGYGKTVKPKS